MKNIVFIFLLFTSSFKALCQENRKNIKGKITNDSLSIENIHIINKNSGKATISNKYGEFLIPVKVNDSLLISSIQFKNKKIIVTNLIINSKKISIILFPRITQLKEIILKKHHLTGNLKTDINTTKIKNVVDQFTLELPNAGRIPIPAIDSLDIQLGLYSKVNLDALYRRISGDFKRLKKLQKLEKEDDSLESIRRLVTDKYLIETLKIPREEIDNFIQHCKSKGIIDLYIKNQKIEVIEILIVESEIYLRKSKE